MKKCVIYLTVPENRIVITLQNQPVLMINTKLRQFLVGQKTVLVTTKSPKNMHVNLFSTTESNKPCGAIKITSYY